MNSTEQFKSRLETELQEIETELKSVGRVNPTNPADWEALPPHMDVERADSQEVAEKIDEYEDNTGILKELEIRLGEVRGALKKIAEGAYGKCEIGGEDIEPDRLEVNPAARTCKAHMEG